MEPVTPQTTLHSHTFTVEMRQHYIVNFSLPRSWSAMSRKRQRRWLRHLDRRPFPINEDI